jgi:hypothetical protein
VVCHRPCAFYSCLNHCMWQSRAVHKASAHNSRIAKQHHQHIFCLSSAATSCASDHPLSFGQFVRPSTTIMSNRAAALWGCTGLSVGVHHYNDNNGIGAPFWQMAGPPVPNPQFNIVKYLISEKDARFVIVVNIESNFLPINNVLIGDILSVHLFLDGFHVSEFLWDTGILIRDRPARVAILASPVNPATSEVRIFKFTEPILCTSHQSSNSSE